MSKVSKKQVDHRNIKVLQFLDIYQKYENLWNPALNSYSNRAARNDSYVQIINELNLPNLTVDDIKSKVKSIRTTYTKELHRLLQSKAEGKKYQPTLFWFKRANAFLKDVSLSRKKHSLEELLHKARQRVTEENAPCNMNYIMSDLKTISPNEVPEETNLSRSADVLNLPQEQYNAQPMPNHVEIMQKQELQILSVNSSISVTATTNTISSTIARPASTSIVEESPCQTEMDHNHDQSKHEHSRINNVESSDTYDMEDEFDAFCRGIAAQLRRISNAYVRSVAKLKIQQIVFEAENGHYSNATCITVPAIVHI